MKLCSMKVYGRGIVISRFILSPMGRVGGWRKRFRDKRGTRDVIMGLACGFRERIERE